MTEYTPDNPLKIAIVGSRKYQSYRKIRTFVYELVEKVGVENLQIVSGEQALGADGFAKKAALEFGVRYISFPPAHYPYNIYCIKEAHHYNKEYRPYNYYTRNTEIVEYSDKIVAFIPPGTKLEDSNGTHDTCKKAEKMGKVVVVLS